MTSRFTLKPITTRPPLVIAVLSMITVVAFLFVNRLVHRFHEQEKALARHLYTQGQTELKAGQPDRAIEAFRAALAYGGDNPQYQLSLARALRDTGRTDESEAYLISLWERSPQDGAVNLALGRLAARQGLLDKTIQYYHNAIYGVWASNPDINRLNARFELIDFLLRKGARPQGQAELINLAAELPPQADLQIRVADLFVRIQDYAHALAEYEAVLKTDHTNVAALTGAGEAAFALGRYRTAERYLQTAIKSNAQDARVAQLLDISKIVLEADPFNPSISKDERNRRFLFVFEKAGERLDNCAKSKGIDLKDQSESNGLAALKARWEKMKPRLAHMDSPREPDLPDSLMNLVSDIEQQTSAECGSPAGVDQALTILTQERNGVDR